MSDTYTSPCCNRTFDKVDSDEDVAEEAQLMWGVVGQDQLETVCDECFKVVMAHFGIIFE